jgi:hypothetical protein
MRRAVLFDTFWLHWLIETPKALRGAPADFGSFSAGEGVRTPAQLVRHMTSVLGYAQTFFVGGKYCPDPLPTLDDEIERFHKMVKDLAGHLVAGTPLHGMSLERILQGPFSDAMTHAGQLAILRRLAGAPVPAREFCPCSDRSGKPGPRSGRPCESRRHLA